MSSAPDAASTLGKAIHNRLKVTIPTQTAEGEKTEVAQ
jgi:hypothetical protein